jgi:hypothetical protein
MTVVGDRRHARLAPRQCALCGEWFTPTNGRQRYCSPVHRAWHRAGLPPVRECRRCGASFAPRHAHQRYCTPAHQREAQTHRQREARREAVSRWRARVRELEREVADARTEDAP